MKEQALLKARRVSSSRKNTYTHTEGAAVTFRIYTHMPHTARRKELKTEQAFLQMRNPGLKCKLPDYEMPEPVSSNAFCASSSSTPPSVRKRKTNKKARKQESTNDEEN